MPFMTSPKADSRIYVFHHKPMRVRLAKRNHALILLIIVCCCYITERPKKSDRLGRFQIFVFNIFIIWILIIKPNVHFLVQQFLQ